MAAVVCLPTAASRKVRQKGFRDLSPSARDQAIRSGKVIVPPVLQFRRPEPTAQAIADCLDRTKAELVETAMSLKHRDILRRNGLADRCAGCRRCPDITG
jgi:hypothetical protein